MISELRKKNLVTMVTRNGTLRFRNRNHLCELVAKTQRMQRLAVFSVHCWFLSQNIFAKDTVGYPLQQYIRMTYRSRDLDLEI